MGLTSLKVAVLEKALPPTIEAKVLYYLLRELMLRKASVALLYIFSL